MDDVTVFEYKRGDKYKVTMVIKDKDVLLFKDLITPADALPETVLSFVEMAEIAALNASEDT